jgi:hypothetical protein
VRPVGSDTDEARDHEGKLMAAKKTSASATPEHGMPVHGWRPDASTAMADAVLLGQNFERSREVAEFVRVTLEGIARDAPEQFERTTRLLSMVAATSNLRTRPRGLLPKLAVTLQVDEEDLLIDAKTRFDRTWLAVFAKKGEKGNMTAPDTAAVRGVLGFLGRASTLDRDELVNAAYASRNSLLIRMTRDPAGLAELVAIWPVTKSGPKAQGGKYSRLRRMLREFGVPMTDEGLRTLDRQEKADARRVRRAR